MKGAGGFALDGLHGGPVLDVHGPECVIFGDWETGKIIVRRIDVDAKAVSNAYVHLFAVR